MYHYSFSQGFRGIGCPLCRKTIVPSIEVHPVNPMHDQIFRNFYMQTCHGQVLRLARARILVFADNQLAQRVSFNMSIALRLDF